jgi:GntR family transcriptional regulator/MocR family aminotransferase
LGQSVGLTIDPRKGEPLYRQIFDEIVRRIDSGAFPAGYKLPPSRVLAQELATHRNTIARAYADLEAAGFVSSTVGRGTFVEAPRPRNERSPVPAGSVPNAGRTGGSISWSSLLARAAKPEQLARAERYARRADARDVVNLARMQPSPDLLPDDLIRRSIDRVLAEHGSKILTYAAPEGVPALREEIARELVSRGVPASADDLVITSGSQQALDLVARALVNPGDTLLVDATTYSGAIDIFALAGARLVTVPGDDEGPDVAALERLVRPEVKAFYVMPNGHNPTGRTITTERRRALVTWSRANGIPLIEDDYGAGIALDDGPSPPALRALDGDVIHLSTLSKRLAPALRVGYILCPPALRSVLCSMKRIVDLGASAILQHALADFMERGLLRAHMRRILPEYRARRDALDESLRKSMPENVTWKRPSHGVVLWVRLPDAIDPDAVYEEALRAGVLVSPSPMWTVGANGGQAERGLRLAFCAESAERVALGARRLGKVIRALMDKADKAPGPPARVVEMV